MGKYTLKFLPSCWLVETDITAPGDIEVESVRQAERFVAALAHVIQCPDSFAAALADGGRVFKYYVCPKRVLIMVERDSHGSGRESTILEEVSWE
jgi:hypothetical protein